MSRSAHLAVVAVLTLANPLTAFAQFVTTETSVSTPTVDRVPSPYAATMDQAVNAIRQGQLDQAAGLLNEVRTLCEAQMSAPDTTYVGFANGAEFLAYTGSAIVEGDEEAASIVALDFRCAGSYQMLGYIRAANRDFEPALELLETAGTLAPYWAQPHIERGYILNQMRRFDEALASYEAALELTGRFESSQAMRPSALRGAGFALIELDRLDDARDAFNESLQLEPGNQLALSELRYIDQLEASRIPDL